MKFSKLLVISAIVASIAMTTTAFAAGTDEVPSAIMEQCAIEVPAISEEEAASWAMEILLKVKIR